MPGKEHGPSIKKPDEYEALKKQGYSKEKAARISNTAAQPGGAKRMAKKAAASREHGTARKKR